MSTSRETDEQVNARAEILANVPHITSCVKTGDYEHIPVALTAVREYLQAEDAAGTASQGAEALLMVVDQQLAELSQGRNDAGQVTLLVAAVREYLEAENARATNGA